MAIGSIGNAVLDLLKVLTPTEIKRLTEFKIGQKGLSKKKLKISSIGGESDHSPEMSTEAAELNLSHSNVLPFSKGAKDKGQEEDPYKDNPSTPQQRLQVQNTVVDSPVQSTSQVFDPLLAVELGPDVTHQEQAQSVVLPNIELTKTEQMLEKAGIMSASKIDHLKKIQEEKEKQGRQSTSVFLLSEREKLAKSLSALKKVEVLKAYKEESLVDIELEKYSNTQDLTTNPGSGVLVNRKHY